MAGPITDWHRPDSLARFWTHGLRAVWLEHRERIIQRHRGLLGVPGHGEGRAEGALSVQDDV